jgi:predicted nucleic acid-binding protein
VTVELADTSAWVVSRRPEAGSAGADFAERLVGLEIATCDTVRLELLYSARTGGEFVDVADELSMVPDCPIGKPEWERALWVYHQLAELGGCHHRSVDHSDLLIAAAAEAAGVGVLHYDEDYDRIAAVTGQPTRWILPRGTV